MLFLYANYYYNIGFNIANIYPLSHNPDEYDISQLKAPSFDWFFLDSLRQSLEEMMELDWEESVGIGAVLGYNDIRAIDIDNCSDIDTIKKILTSLGLCEEYEWVIKTGNGYHIIVKSEYHDYKIDKNQVKSFLSNKEMNGKFHHLELRYNGHIVLPPSIHYTYKKYKFINNNIPYKAPLHVDLNSIKNMINQFCNIYPDQKELKEIKLTESQYHLSYDRPEYEIYGGYFLILDCETNGLPIDIYAPYTDLDNWPRLVGCISILRSLL